MATSNGLETEGCCRCQKNEASIQCSECIVENKCSLYCDDCYTIVHKGGLSKHTCVRLTAKLLSELESKAHSLDTSLNIERLRLRIEAECERQKSEIDLHLSQAQNEVKTLCNVLRNSIDTQETTLMLNISQIRNVRQTELEDLRSHSIQSLEVTERQMRDTLERLKVVTPKTPKVDLMMLKHQLEVIERNGYIQAPILPCISCVTLPDTKRLENTLTTQLNTMPIINLWKINVSRDVKVVYIQENSCRFFLMDRQQSAEQIGQNVLYHSYRIHESFRHNLSPITSPDVGQLCIAVTKNNCLMRAIIEGVTDDKNKVKVFYLDIGDSGIVDNSQKSCVFPLDNKLLFYPFACYYCQIDLDYDEHNKTIERQIRWFLRDLTPRNNGLTACLKRKEFLKTGIALHYIDLKDNDSPPESEPLMTQLQERVDKAGAGRVKPENFKSQDIRVLQNSHEGVSHTPPIKNPHQIDPTFGYPSDISIVQYPTFRTAMPYSIPSYGYQQPVQQMPSIYYSGYLPVTAVRSHHTPPPSSSEPIVSPPLPHPPSPLPIPEVPENRPRVPAGAKAVTNSVTEDTHEDTPPPQQVSQH
ncbi:hypothetical protein LOD99_12603 [Oopsacas minuta]|uniref:Tudor domain-containing protein n=1 Tax=Oopsacas minuta TaxID=111878 RepID=A0AAV7JCK5_9METZ|nr:hypothetical protein LOD99_12603 [Oopsacas minuta]